MAIVIQAGHVHIEQNCNEGLRGETGAPGEREYVGGIAAQVAGGLQAHGQICIVADANFNCTNDAAQNTYQAVVALHCDGRSTSGFAVGVGNPTQDGAAAESEHLRASLRSAYAAATALPDLDNLGNNPNVTDYYLFDVLTPATPFALIELGAIANAEGSPGSDRDYLLSHTNQVAEGIANGIMDFLGISQTPAEPAGSGSVPESVPVNPPASPPAPAPTDSTPSSPSSPAPIPGSLAMDKLRAIISELSALLAELK